MRKSADFFNAYDFAEQVVQGNIEHFQLMAGNFYGELIQIISDTVIVSTHSMNLPILQIGKGVKDYITFLMPGNMEADVSWRKHQLSRKRIGVLKSDGIHFGITPANFFATPISIHTDFLHELLIKKGKDKAIYNFIQHSEAIDLNPEDAYEIQKTAISLCNSKRVNYKLLQEKLPRLIVNSISKVADKAVVLPSSRNKLISKTLIYIHQNLERKLNTKEICNALDISERNLRYVFTELIGVSPMKYIKLIRLNKARKEIRKTGENSVINLIANKWGFNHSGQFAIDYKNLFGELPSETFKHNKSI